MYSGILPLIHFIKRINQKAPPPLTEEDTIKLSMLKNKNPLTEEEIKDFFEKKDCTAYKPNKRIQCDISLFNAGLTTQLETINDIKIALLEWEKETGTSESFYFIGLDTINWALAIGHAELVLGSTYASLTMMLPRYHRKEYLHHFSTSNKPTIVYSYNEMQGNEIIDHWNTWTAIEGTEHKNILYVSETKASSRNAKTDKDECKNFYFLFKCEKLQWVGLGELASTRAGRDDTTIAKGEGPAAYRHFQALTAVISMLILSMNNISFFDAVATLILLRQWEDDRILCLFLAFFGQNISFLAGVFCTRKDTLTSELTARAIPALAAPETGRNSTDISPVELITALLPQPPILTSGRKSKWQPDTGLQLLYSTVDLKPP